MTKNHPTPPAPKPAPTAVGDIVEGNPPVPITLWHIPAPTPGVAVSGRLVRRLRANYAHRGSPVIDLTIDQHATPTRENVALVLTTWPRPEITATEHLADCAHALRPGGCAAIVVAPTDIPDQLGAIVTAAREAGLTYLQHLVIAHLLRPTTPPHATHPSPANPDRPQRHLRVHTDVLVVARPQDAHA